MKFKYQTRAMVLLLSLLWATFVPAADDTAAHYELAITLNPETHVLDIDATVTVPVAYAGKTVEFLLTNAVEIIDSSAPIGSLPYSGEQAFSGINGSSVDLTETGNVARYRVALGAGETSFKIHYRGEVNFALGGQAEQYTRGFQSTAGIINKKGVYLAGSSLWYPYFSDELVSFALATNVPDGWHLISQGNGSSRNDENMATWDSAGLVDEIYLVGGPLLKYEEAAGAIAAEVYLHEADDALAQRYLTATAQYLEMYRNLIGPYPYGKFALIENFWETGYGMPSFTLLGPQIIRFPFILTSSYPHEILHNWWGNSVFVDYSTGNWCEGLTAYMADHLMQEQRASAAPYRRDTLKKYRDFVTEGKDFPLTEFRSRHSAATEAVGYGKVLMGFHMLRRQMGDEAFRQAMARFYRSNRGKQATFADARIALEAASGLELGVFFEQWVERVGAPNLSVVDAKVVADGSGYAVTAALLQSQSGEAYQLNVPVYVTTTNGLEMSTVAVSKTREVFTIRTKAQPLLLEVDPEFDLFRLLDPRETAPSIGQIFGEQEILAVIPATATPEKRAAYRELVNSWQSEAHRIQIVMDTALGELPDTQAAWFFGAENRMAPRLFGEDAGIDLTLGSDELVAAGQAIPLEGNSAVIVRRHPGNQAKAIGWISIDPLAAFPGMSSKLPHYGKYSYLGFVGDEPANNVKGEWVATDSPLRLDLRDPAAQEGTVKTFAPPPRPALAELPPVFSSDKLEQHVQVLASEEMAGRGLGTPGLELAADYIVQQFKAAGLKPGAADGTYSQVFPVAEGEDGKPHDVRNIIAVIPGTNPAMQGETVLVTAHYDHLGHGWPDERADAGEGIYYGADDNASGVSVLLELAKTMAGEAAPERTIVFIAFTGEEAGLLGSQYFVANPQPYALDGMIGVVNMDTVGRLGAQKVSVFGANTASEWQHVFRGIGFTTGIASTLITNDLDSSDHTSFINAGIPGIQISSGASLDYHRPSDTADKIDGDGLVKIAMVVKEAVVYLAARPDALTATIDTAARSKRTASADQPGRRVSVGTVPDFGYTGKGVLVSAVVPESPAAKAGLLPGDVLVRMGDKSVDNLQGFTDLLKAFEPGQTVMLTVLRDGAELSKEVQLVAR